MFILAHKHHKGVTKLVQVDEFKLNYGTELTITRYIDLKSSKLYFKVDGGVKKSIKFTPSTTCKDADGEYSDAEVSSLLKDSGSFDDLDLWKKMYVKYGSSEQRAEEVYNHRSEL